MPSQQRSNHRRLPLLRTAVAGVFFLVTISAIFPTTVTADASRVLQVQTQTKSDDTLFVHGSSESTTTTNDDSGFGLGPSTAHARARHAHLFNAVANGARQFGSSLRHNGMSVVPLTVSEGTLLYHGTHTTEIPGGFEWLAFEIEHAENFARSWVRPRNGSWGRPPPPGKGEGEEGQTMNVKRGRGRIDIRTATATAAAVPGDGLLGIHGRAGLVGDAVAAGGAVERRGLTSPSPPRSGHHDDDDDDDWIQEPGYLHVYRAARPLRLLYVDGMAAAKTWRGTLDTQDLLLTGPHRDRGGFDGGKDGERAAMDEWARASDLCALRHDDDDDDSDKEDGERGQKRNGGQGWKVDGFVRMEPGFEIIYCDFRPGQGLELVGRPRRRSMPGDPGNLVGSPGPKPPPKDGDDDDDDDGGEEEERRRANNINMAAFQWARAASQRYDGIGGGRARLDWSRMTSAFWYPGDLGLLPDNDTSAKQQHMKKKKKDDDDGDYEHEIHPRLTNLTDAQLAVIKEDARLAVEESCSTTIPTTTTTDWQALADMIIARFADPLRLMRDTEHLYRVQMEVVNLLDAHTEYDVPGQSWRERDEATRRRCVSDWLRPVTELQGGIKTVADRMLLAAFERTMEKICGTLVEVREVVIEEEEEEDEDDRGATRNNNKNGHRQQGKEDEDAKQLALAQGLVRGLMKTLDWSRWKECGRCPGAEEVCFVAMWPVGDVEDHYAPRCLGVEDNISVRRSYWFDWDGDGDQGDDNDDGGDGDGEEEGGVVSEEEPGEL